MSKSADFREVAGSFIAAVAIVTVTAAVVGDRKGAVRTAAAQLVPLILGDGDAPDSAPPTVVAETEVRHQATTEELQATRQSLTRLQAELANIEREQASLAGRQPGSESPEP
jgi:hypothetical protein